MRLFHLYSGNLYGGIERVLVTLAATDGATQRFGLFFEGRLASELRAAGAQIDMLGAAALSRPWTIARGRRTLARILAEARPDVVLAHSLWTAAVAGGTIAAAGPRSALWLHNPPNRSVWPDRWGLRQHFDVVIANSEYTARAAATHLRVAGWMYPPVPRPPATALRARATTRTRLGAADADVVILQASRIERWKGLREHVLALASLRDVPRWTAWIAGAPQNHEQRRFFEGLRELSEARGIAQRIRFLGHRSDMSEVMAATDIYCQPNREPEPFGVALVEAMWAGVPIVTTATGGLSDDIARACGIAVPCGDPAAVSGALRGLVLDTDRRRSLGAGGPDLAARLCDPSRQLVRLGALLGSGSLVQ